MAPADDMQTMPYPIIAGMGNLVRYQVHSLWYEYTVSQSLHTYMHANSLCATRLVRKGSERHSARQ